MAIAEIKNSHGNEEVIEYARGSKIKGSVPYSVSSTKDDGFLYVRKRCLPVDEHNEFVNCFFFIQIYKYLPVLMCGGL